MKNPSSHEKTESVLVKKYANRRLYNTQTSSYITFEQLIEMVKNDVSFEVIDAKTNQNLTRAVLLQILLEQETGGAQMLSAEFLKMLIRYVDTDSHQMISTYVEQMTAAFQQNMQGFKAMPNTAQQWQDWWQQSMKPFTSEK